MAQARPRIDEKAVLRAAVRYHQAGDLAKAKDLYRVILAQNRKHAEAIFRIGTIALQVEQYEKAADYIQQAVKIGPATSAMLINLGAALRNLEKYDEAIAVYDRAIKLKQNLADAYYNKGRTLQAAERFEEAQESYKRALALNDSDVDAWVNLATVQRELGYRGEPNYLDAALESCETALRIDPATAAAYGNAAGVMFTQALFEMSTILMDKAIELDPENYEYRSKLSNFLLTFGNLEQGWKDFDTRFLYNKRGRATRRLEPPPYWDGQDLKDIKLLLWTEQGLGEELLSAGILPDVIGTGAQVTVECSARFVPILKRSFPSIEVTEWTWDKDKPSVKEPPYDYQYPALSMIKTFRPNVESIVSHAPYIKPDSGLVAEFRKKYERVAAGRRIVGISWRSKNAEFGTAKSAPLEDWKRILALENTLFINLQYGDCTEEIAALEREHGLEVFVDPEVNALGDLDPVLAQIAAMDLVVSSSNTNVHFAAAMNVPVWTMLPKARGLLWFWFMDREDSPWYPSMRLFRQQSTPSSDQSWWPEVIDEVSRALSDWLDKPLPPRAGS